MRSSVAAIYLTSLVQGSVGVIFPASSTYLRGKLALGDTLYGALFLPGIGLALITALMGHVLLRRWSLKSLYMFGLISQAAAMALMGISGSLDRASGLPLLIAAMVISGPAGGLMGIALNTAAIEIFPRSRSGALSALHALLGAGATLGPMLVATCTGLGVWRAAPLSLAAAGLLIAWFVRARPIAGLADMLVEAHRHAAVPRRISVRSTTVLIYGIGEATFTSWAVIFLVERNGMPLEVAAGALSAFWLAMTLGRFGSSVVVRWAGAYRIALALALCMSAAFLLVAHSRGPTDSLLRFAFAGLSCSALFPLLLGLTSEELPERTARVSAVFSASVLAGLGIGAFGVGPLRASLGLARIYTWSALGPLVLIGLLVALQRRGVAAAVRPSVEVAAAVPRAERAEVQSTVGS